MRGKTINIYIPDGNPRSVRICSRPNSTISGIFIPRNKLKEEVAQRDELDKAGIYFLIGSDEDILDIYVGEAEPLLKRLSQHNHKKDFWKYAICFSSVKDNLNKAHIKYLENYCYEKAKQVNKCRINNSVIPTRSNLTESDVDFILDIFDEIKLLISALGYPIFDEEKKEKKNIFYCKGKDAFAEGEYIEDGFLVFKGSKANFEESKTAGPWLTNLRKKLIDENILVEKNNVLEFEKNYLFSSPSASAATILARRANGWTEWKDKQGKTLDERFRNEK